MSLSIPLDVKRGLFGRPKTTKEAIDDFLELLMQTPCGTFAPDPNFGFIFNNLRFEIFDEKEGVIYNSDKNDRTHQGLYDKKVSGSSRSINTFAAELKKAIDTYEKRLQNVKVVLAYDKNRRCIVVNVKAVMTQTMEEYEYSSTIKVWN